MQDIKDYINDLASYSRIQNIRGKEENINKEKQKIIESLSVESVHSTKSYISCPCYFSKIILFPVTFPHHTLYSGCMIFILCEHNKLYLTFDPLFMLFLLL